MRRTYMGQGLMVVQGRMQRVGVGGAPGGAHQRPQIWGMGGAGCRSTQILSTAAEMGGTARREGERYAPAGSLPAAPTSAQ